MPDLDTLRALKKRVDGGDPTLWARFEEKYIPEPNSGCWLWIGGQNGHGYGRIWSQGRMIPAHWIAYIRTWGIIPAGHELDHLCRIRSCVNPDHLEPVTRSENTRRGLAPNVGRKTQSAKTHCPQGHPYSGDNLYISPSGYRNCRTCQRASERRYKAKKTALIAEEEAKRENTANA